MSSKFDQNIERKLTDLFSGYRAEWINEDIFALFTEPSYFPQLTTSHPCFLVGGRGTGKTTALRCLSYQGQCELKGDIACQETSWNYFGMYHRVNTNRVRAFDGPELIESSWIRVFGHYINLEFCEQLISLLCWYTSYFPNAPKIGINALHRVSTTLHLEVPRSLDEFRDVLNLSKLEFEAGINNVADDKRMPKLSLQGAPIDTFVEEIRRLPQFRDRDFFFLIDEYENLNSYQQRVLNTLIKHCGEHYSFKVGVRELGFRERSTLNAMEQLTHPADYKRIDITQELEERFAAFAAEVCARRLTRVLGVAASIPDVKEMLPELTPEEEARRLGIDEVLATVMRELSEGDPQTASVKRWFEETTPLEKLVLLLRASAENKSVSDKVQEVWDNPVRWREQYGNYMHAYLFTIRRGKRGIRKYFAGWRVYCLLAGANIRYLLELVDQAFNLHLAEGFDPLQQSVDPDTQTRAAQKTGQKNLRELEGLSLHGARLTRLLLGLGRIFQVMATDPVGHTPEVNQFFLAADVDDEDLRKQVDELLSEGVMHLALVRYRGSKLQQESDIRQFDYSVHPIFSPFFEFSHRRKRKIELSDLDVWSLVERPTESIRGIVGRQNRTIEDDLPEQMNLFRDYYGKAN